MGRGVENESEGWGGEWRMRARDGGNGDSWFRRQ